MQKHLPAIVVASLMVSAAAFAQTPTPPASSGAVGSREDNDAAHFGQARGYHTYR